MKAMVTVGVWGLLFLGFGCIGKSEPARFYTLSPVNIQEPAMPAEAHATTITIGLGPIEFPEYLNRPQIVTRRNPNELYISEVRRWAERLSENFAQTLSENLSRALGIDNVFVYPWPPQIDVNWQVLLDLNRFEGKIGDKVNLIARWVVVDGKEDRVRMIRKSRITVPVEKGGNNPYGALVAAKSHALAILGEEIAREIQRLEEEK